MGVYWGFCQLWHKKQTKDNNKAGGPDHRQQEKILFGGTDPSPSPLQGCCGAGK